MSSLSREDLLKKYHTRMTELKNIRTSATLRNARQTVSKKEQTKLAREVRKKGVKALTSKLGINDPEIEQMVATLIKNGEVKDADEVVKKIAEYHARKKNQADVHALEQKGPPPEILENTAAIPSLPGANPKRKSLKPLQQTFNNPVNINFEQWLKEGFK